MVYFNPLSSSLFTEGKPTLLPALFLLVLFVWMGVEVERGGGAFGEGSWEHESLGNDPSNLQNQP